MPRRVDHATRRLEIIRATWRTMAREGVEATTLRKIAEEAGFANGAIGHYFHGKDELLAAAYTHVFTRTNERIAAVTHNLHGMAALRAYCHEILPLDEDRLLEARIVLPFWQQALTRDGQQEMYEGHMASWTQELVGLIEQARTDGAITSAQPDADIAGQLLAMLTGWQVLALLTPASADPAVQVAQLDAYLDGLDPAGRAG
ncbi:TetR/AcrR family transcriptional regulator [Pseudonocardia nigra]|uniref:TetR/AcrR family transcriptional regulator n=1 Tax=Pseudonocardia nigra TaxID=1921578 RepID=UPI001C5CFE97|nr:TetR family transcriptional regulator C-terminal domain-containing protein [Pseudonocardia nigra]